MITLQDTVGILEELQTIIIEMEDERSYSEYVNGISAGFTKYEQTLFERLQEKLGDAIDALGGNPDDVLTN